MSSLMTRCALALLAMHVAGCSTLPHPDNWSRGTRVAEATYQAIHVADLAQTLQIADHPDQYYEAETAWQMGKHPSRQSVWLWYTSHAIAHAMVTDYLQRHNAPDWLQRTWHIVSISVAGEAVVNNAVIGIKLKF